MKVNPESSLLNSFLLIYFFEIEQKLNNEENQLKKIKFQSEESNTDEFLKKYFKDYLSKHNNIESTELKQLKVKGDEEEFIVNVDELHSYKILNVLLPEELTKEQKQNIADSKKSVYTNPDLYLEIADRNYTYFESVELKSTKNNKIPGSSIQQVSPFEWVIFVKRSKDNVEITTGYYLNSITNKLPFPDRSPRPQIGFKTLENWNKKYRKVKNQVLTVENITDLNEEKISLLNDWQDYLAKEWLSIIQADSSKNNEKWFNNALRKFAIKFLDYTEKLNEKEKAKLRLKLMKMIK